MQSQDQIPIHSSPAVVHRSPKRHHHTPRYYAHRVRESLTTRVSKIICSIFLSLLLVLGLIFFIRWIRLRPHRPRIHIEDFSVPGLGQPSGFENAEIAFNVTARNSNQHVGFYYDSMQGTVYYKDQQIGSTSLLGAFYQEPKSTTILYKVLTGATLTVNSQSWAQFSNDRATGKVVFRLDISCYIKFKVSTWDSKRHRMHATCDVEVGPDGTILATSKDKRCPVYFT